MNVDQTDRNVIHNLFAGFHYPDDLGVIKSKLAEYVATVRKEQIAQDIQLARDVWEDGLKDERSALQMKEWIINALTRQDYDALVRVCKEAREAAFKEVLGIARAELVSEPCGEIDTCYNTATKDVIRKIEALANSEEGEMNG